MPKTKKTSVKPKSKRRPRSKSKLVSIVQLPKFSRGAVLFLVAILGLFGVLLVWLVRGSTLQDQYSYAGKATQGLDPTGRTIPETNYAIPAGAIYISPNGNDANDGKSTNAPIKTLTKAIATIPAGGTIVALAGVYRDAHIPISNNKYTPTTKNFILQAYPKSQVWFDGTDVVTNWTNNGNNTWSVAWSTPNFCHLYNYNTAGGYYDQIWPWNGTPAQKGPCAHADMIKDASTDPDPQMVFVNDASLKQVRSLSAVTTGTFYYDVASRKVVIGTNPAGNTVEVTKRPSALMLEGGSGGNVIRGIGFRKFATNEQFEGSYTGGAIMVNVPNTRIENVVFDRNAGGALVVYNPSGAVITRTIFANNGFSGISSNGTSHKTTTPNNFKVEGNIFNNNNIALFGPGCGESCSAAAIKVAHMKGMSFKNNMVENQQGVAAGFWCDLKCEEVTVANNVFRNNGGHGIFYEVSNTGIIAGNIVTNNKRYGIKVSAANTKIYNNTVAGNIGGGALIYDDNRTPGVGGWNDISPNSTNIEFVNNLMYENKPVEVDSWRTGDSPNTGPNTFYAKYDNNAYYHASASIPVAHWIDPKGTDVKYQTLSSFSTARGWEKSGFELTSYADPFVNRLAEDYRLKSDAQANIRKGVALPADVANAVGVATGAVLAHGAVYDATVLPPASTQTPTPTSVLTQTPTPVSTKTPTPTPPLPPTTTKLTAPTNLKQGFVFSNALTIDWGSSSGGVGQINYKIFVNDSLQGTTTGNNYSISNLQPNTTYKIRVTASDQSQPAQSINSATLSVKTYSWCFLWWCW